MTRILIENYGIAQDDDSGRAIPLLIRSSAPWREAAELDTLASNNEATVPELVSALEKFINPQAPGI